MIYQSTNTRIFILALVLFLGNQVVAQDTPERERRVYPREFLLQFQPVCQDLSEEQLRTLPPEALNVRGRQALTDLRFRQAQARARTRNRAAQRRALAERKRRKAAAAEAARRRARNQRRAAQRRAQRARKRAEAARQLAQEGERRIAQAELAMVARNLHNPFAGSPNGGPDMSVEVNRFALLEQDVPA